VRAAARVADLPPASPLTDIRNADEELAARRGYDRSAFGLSRALDELPELVRSSWAVLHRHYKHRLSAADFAHARAALLDAADGFGFALKESTGSLEVHPEAARIMREHNGDPSGSSLTSRPAPSRVPLMGFARHRRRD